MHVAQKSLAYVMFTDFCICKRRINIKFTFLFKTIFAVMAVYVIRLIIMWLLKLLTILRLEKKLVQFFGNN